MSHDAPAGLQVPCSRARESIALLPIGLKATTLSAASRDSPTTTSMKDLRVAIGKFGSRTVLASVVFVLCLGLGVAAAHARRAVDPARMVSLWKPTFTNPASVPEKVRKCRMTEVLTENLQLTAPRQGAAVRFAESEQSFLAASKQLVISIDNVDAFDWRFHSLRPSGSAVFKFQIVIDGRVVDEVEEKIHATPLLSLAICRRMEDAAGAAGRFAAEWVARAKY